MMENLSEDLLDTWTQVDQMHVNEFYHAAVAKTDAEFEKKWAEYLAQADAFGLADLEKAVNINFHKITGN